LQEISLHVVIASEEGRTSPSLPPPHKPPSPPCDTSAQLLGFIFSFPFSWVRKSANNPEMSRTDKASSLCRFMEGQ